MREVLCKLEPECNEWLNQSLHGEGCRHQTIAGQTEAIRRSWAAHSALSNSDLIKRHIKQGAAKSGSDMQSHAADKPAPILDIYINI